MKPSVKLATITPRIAETMLDRRNDHNRSVTWSRVQQYAQDMRRGEWMMNGEAIKIAEDGKILDGQHRLMAILEADLPVAMLLVTGLDPASQESMDQGKPRGFHDALRLRGEPDYNVLAAAVKKVAMFERDGAPFNRPFVAPISNQTAARTLRLNPEIRDSCVHANRLRQPWMPVSTMGALHFLMASVDEGAAEAFFEQLSKGDGNSTVIRTLRERLIEAHELSTAYQRTHINVRTVYVVIGWNAYMQHAPLGPLFWSSGEPFPGIWGLVDSNELELAA